MALVKFENKVFDFIDSDGNIVFCPMIKLGDGQFNFISHQGQVMQYSTKQEAEQYFKNQ